MYEETTIYIEHCSHCNSHQWCTSHDEKKYQYFYQNVKTAIQIQFPNFLVLENQLKLSSEVTINCDDPNNPFKYKNPQGIYVTFPQMGSFEVIFMNKKIFSKLTLGVWPNSKKIVSKIQDVLRGIETKDYSFITTEEKSKLLNESFLFSRAKSRGHSRGQTPNSSNEKSGFIKEKLITSNKKTPKINENIGNFPPYLANGFFLGKFPLKINNYEEKTVIIQENPKRLSRKEEKVEVLMRKRDDSLIKRDSKKQIDNLIEKPEFFIKNRESSIVRKEINKLPEFFTVKVDDFLKNNENYHNPEAFTKKSQNSINTHIDSNIQRAENPLKINESDPEKTTLEIKQIPALIEETFIVTFPKHTNEEYYDDFENLDYETYKEANNNDQTYKEVNNNDQTYKEANNNDQNIIHNNNNNSIDFHYNFNNNKIIPKDSPKIVLNETHKENNVSLKKIPQKIIKRETSKETQKDDSFLNVSQESSENHKKRPKTPLNPLIKSNKQAQNLKNLEPILKSQFSNETNSPLQNSFSPKKLLYDYNVDFENKSPISLNKSRDLSPLRVGFSTNSFKESPKTKLSKLEPLKEQLKYLEELPKKLDKLMPINSRPITQEGNIRNKSIKKEKSDDLMFEIEKLCSLDIQIQKAVKKKITITNDEENSANIKVASSDPERLNIINPDNFIEGMKNVKISLLFKEYPVLDQILYKIYIMKDGKPWQKIMLTANYISDK